MFNIVPPMMALLWLVGGNEAQKYDCDYLQKMEPGKTYYVFNDNYPQSYKPGKSCRWVARSDRPITLTCDTFKLPSSNQCTQDAVTIQDGSTLPSHRYCGTGTFSLTSKSNEITIILTSPPTSPGGRFLCTLQTAATDDNNNCICGLKNPTKIVGGIETGVNEFPMMAGLVDSRDRLLFCGATIINERQVLTAAHCIATKQISSYGVLVGEHDISTGSETNATRIFLVESVSINSLYNSGTQDYDIALITVIGKITFNQKIRPVCLPFQHSPDTFAGNYVEVLGWGSTEFGGGPSKTLQKVRLTVITNDQCRQTYRDLTNRQLCTYGYEKDSCQFDSGGPVLWQNPSTGRLVSIGVISLGSACGDEDPAVNGRVGAYMDWIVANTPRGIQYCKLE